MNALCQSALYWYDQGVVPIPLKPRSKTPIYKWRKWQTNVPTLSDVKKWFKNDERNIGLVCGGNGGLAVLDFDKIQLYHRWRIEMREKGGLVGEIAENAYRVKTRRGMHVYVRTNEMVHTTHIQDLELDIKAAGGYVVTAPSVHPSGHPYVPVGGKLYTVDHVNDLLGHYVLCQAILDDDVFVPVEVDESTPQYQVIKKIKATNDVLTVASRLTKMYPTSGDGRWWMGCCPHPAHSDHHPSFRVDRLRQKCQCMSPSCDLYEPRGLDVIDLYASINGIDNATAIMELTELLPSSLP